MVKGDLSLRHNSDSVSFEIDNHFVLDPTIEAYRLRLGSEWYGVYFSFRGIVIWLWESEVFIYDGDEISGWHELIICSGKVVSVYLLTDRNYVFKL